MAMVTKVVGVISLNWTNKWLINPLLATQNHFVKKLTLK